jgi:ADP-ribose pyrophosphatase
LQIPERLEAYFALAAARPELFDNTGAGLRILMEPAEILRVEEDVARGLEKRGMPARLGHVGIVYEDPWFLVLRDAVEFPDGSRRTHARTVNYTGDGAAVLPVHEGRIVMLCHYRHPPRRWLLEIPRGGIEPGRTPEETAHAEIREEMGGEITRLERLGFLYGSTNLYRNGAHLFYAELSAIGEPQLGEGISGFEFLAIPQFEAMIREGKLHDCFAVGAFAHARLRGLL